MPGFDHSDGGVVGAYASFEEEETPERNGWARGESGYEKGERCQKQDGAEEPVGRGGCLRD